MAGILTHYIIKIAVVGSGSILALCVATKLWRRSVENKCAPSEDDATTNVEEDSTTEPDTIEPTETSLTFADVKGYQKIGKYRLY